MPEYVLFSKFWNEAERLEEFIRHISKQTVQPLIWVFGDDGSTDNSREIVEATCTDEGINYVLGGRKTPKLKPSGDSIGVTYNAVLDEYRERLNALKPSYWCMLDVDTRLPDDYYETGIHIMEKHESIGVIAGHIRQDPIRRMPQGSGSIHRWEVFQAIDKVWRMDGDSLFNIKSTRLGYHNVVVSDWYIDANPSSEFGDEYRYLYGRRNWYTRYPPLVILYEVFVPFLRGRKRIDIQRLVGYTHEALSGSPRFDDEDVIRYHSMYEYFYRMLKFKNRHIRRFKLAQLI